MMITPPDTLAVHDLSGFGHTSLMVVIPILTRMGVEITALPTSLLSTNTEFPQYVMQDNTLLMEAILKHWKSLSLRFDAVYTGFLGSTDQVELLIKNIPVLKTPNSIVLVDPVLADWGKLYGCYDLRMVEAMRKLVCEADIITPNLTEAAFLWATSIRKRMKRWIFYPGAGNWQPWVRIMWLSPVLRALEPKMSFGCQTLWYAMTRARIA
ncbi:MAG: bifunctional hydroxymethylpyrimidine kinase/phosphomethylpyrimidine kinase [Candidatus Cloacimonetes bacterium]|nr:bifunctional hydroxymethylpyrimidine kinase/phosphomethylpyrimidine kinase [Candidatus Cloacimonadota bacterium]